MKRRSCCRPPAAAMAATAAMVRVALVGLGIKPIPHREVGRTDTDDHCFLNQCKN